MFFFGWYFSIIYIQKNFRNESGFKKVKKLWKLVLFLFKFVLNELGKQRTVRESDRINENPIYLRANCWFY